MSEFPSLILLNNIPLYVYTTVCLSFFCWWTLGLPPLTIANNTAMNMGIRIFLWHLVLNSPRGGIATSYSNQFSSVRLLSHAWLCNPMDCSMPGFPVHHQLLELAQTHIHRVGDAFQPSLPLSSPSPPAFYLSHDQGLFQWVSSNHQVAKVWEPQLQHQSFQWIFRTDFL